MGNQIQKNLKISSDVTDWHDVAAGRESVCNWMREATRYLSEFDDLGRCVASPTHPIPTTPVHLSKGAYLKNVVLKFSGSE